MPQKLLQNVLQESELEVNLYKWLINDITDNVLNGTYNCSKTDFIVYFLNFVRNQTNRFLKINEDSNAANDSLNNPGNNEKYQFDDKNILSKDSYYESNITAQDRNFSAEQSRFSNNSNFDNVFNENVFSPVPHSSSFKNNDSSNSVYFSTPTDQKKKNNSVGNRSHSKFQKSNERVSINFGDYMQSFSNKKKPLNVSKSKSINEKQDSTCSIDNASNEIHNLKNITLSPEENKSTDFPALGQRTSFQSNSFSGANRSKRIKPTSLNFNDSESDKNKSKGISFNGVNEWQNSVISNSFQTERSILKNEKDFIKKQFQNTKHLKTVYINPKEKQTVMKELDPGDISKVTNKRQIDILANIYTVLLNNNLHTNFISEMSFVFSLLNVEESETLLDDSDLFATFHNCIYFCVKVLQGQKHFFILLDSDTLKVLCENKRIITYNPKLNDFFKNIFKQKCNSISLVDNNIMNKNNVCFQSETDNRENFTSDQTFRAFRKQRDLFYDILRNWETSHNTPNYTFAFYDNTLLTLFNIKGALLPNKAQQKKNEQTDFGRLNTAYNNVCNMAHFARLFVKQLLISCETEHTEFNQLVMESLPNVDPNRLSRLSNRFITNATTTSDATAFVGVQEFFRDFIQYCDNHTFLEHLKIVMCNEILDMNSACLDIKISDILNMHVNAKDKNKTIKSLVKDDLQLNLELVKKTSSLRLLAKFLGFVTDLPYNNNGYKMRSLSFSLLNKIEIYPLLDFGSILSSCSDIFSTFLVVQWITMYLAMLNEETLLTEKYKNLIQQLFEIYIKSSISNSYTDTTVYLKYCLKIILGNFFDLPNVSISFFEWRFSTSFKELNEIRENKELIILSKNQFEKIPLGINFLEKILYQNLPFLSTLKNVIKGFKTYNKGRIRHVTPFTHQTNTGNKDAKNKIQIQLEHQFFNNQPSSVKRTVDFVAERIASVIIKEIVAKDVAQAKSSVSEKFLDVKLIKKPEIEMQVISICTESFKELTIQCNSTIQKISDERIASTIKNLLPVEMLDEVKGTCIKICTKKVIAKCQTWLKDNLTDINVLCKDIDAQVQQIFKNNTICNVTINSSLKENPLQISNTGNVNEFLSDTGPSEILIDLQDILCNISSKEYTAELLIQELKSILNRIEECINVWNMFLNLFIKILASLTIDITIALACHYPKCLKQILPKLCSIWKIEAFCSFIKTDCKNEEELEESLHDITEKPEDETNICNTDDHIFLKIISSRTVCLLSENQNDEEVWNNYSHLVANLIRENFLTIDSFGEAALKLLRSEWSNETLHHLSKSIKSIMTDYQNVKSADCTEITLLLEWMAEFCDDIDLL